MTYECERRCERRIKIYICGVHFCTFRVMITLMWFDLSCFRDVDYYNAKGRLIDQHTVCATDSAGKEVND